MTVAERIVIAIQSVRVLSVEQVVRHFAPNRDGQTIRRAIQRLGARGVTESFQAMVPPILEMSEPLAVWEPGDVFPDADRLSYAAQGRWTDTPQRTLLVTRKAGGRKKQRLDDIRHDLHVSELFLRWLAKEPEEALLWVSEDDLRARGVEGDFVPDALVGEGATQRIVEFIGSYSAQKLRLMFEGYRGFGVAVELW